MKEINYGVPGYFSVQRPSTQEKQSNFWHKEGKRFPVYPKYGKIKKILGIRRRKRLRYVQKYKKSKKILNIKRRKKLVYIQKYTLLQNSRQ